MRASNGTFEMQHPDGIVKKCAACESESTSRKFCSQPQIDGLAIFNQTGLAQTIDAFVQGHAIRHAQCVIILNGPPLTEKTTSADTGFEEKSSSDDSDLYFNSDSVDVLAQITAPLPNTTQIYRATLPRAILLQYQLLAIRCALNLVCVTSARADTLHRSEAVPPQLNFITPVPLHVQRALNIWWRSSLVLIGVTIGACTFISWQQQRELATLQQQLPQKNYLHEIEQLSNKHAELKKEHESLCSILAHRKRRIDYPHTPTIPLRTIAQQIPETLCLTNLRYKKNYAVELHGLAKNLSDLREFVAHLNNSPVFDAMRITSISGNSKEVQSENYAPFTFALHGQIVWQRGT